MTGEIALITVKVVAAAVTGFLAGHAAVYIFNRIPVHWLCDYGRKPEGTLADPSRQRIKGYPWKLVYSAFFTAGLIYLVFYDWQYAAAAAVFCWALLEIAIADKKYSIIPDQFVILAAISALGFVPYFESFREPVYGVVTGAGIMLIVALIGYAVFRKESLGFGDVKLMAAIGLVAGPSGVLAIMVLASVSAAVLFGILLIMKRVKRTDMVPVGPCICAAGIFYVVIICPLL